jgi:tRNA nucleotidyltransferase (CCA-adding enzyme)
MGKIKLPEELLAVIGLIADTAKENSSKAFLVGGFVRDILLGVSNLDLDIVVEGSGINTARAFADRNHSSCVVHEGFGTATVSMPDAVKVDFATARKEVYKKPGALPSVRFDTLREDLFRRDFTINAMAIAIAKDDCGRLIDFFGGQKDLADKKIRILHDKSFIDDPTRMLRAVRFEQKLNFKIEPHTQRLLKEALANNMLEAVGKRRLDKEIALILKEECSKKIFKRIKELGIKVNGF